MTTVKRRLFFAIPLNPDLKHFCSELLNEKQINNDIKWVKEQNLHITVLFIGSVNEEDIGAVIKKAETIIADFEPLEFSPESVCFMPSEKKAKMLWIRFDRNLTFSGLYLKLRSELIEYFQAEPERDPIPHITLARIKNRKSFILPEFNSIPGIQVEKIELWESQTKAEGVEYSCINSFNLKKKS